MRTRCEQKRMWRAAGGMAVVVSFLLTGGAVYGETVLEIWEPGFEDRWTRIGDAWYPGAPPWDPSYEGDWCISSLHAPGVSDPFDHEDYWNHEGLGSLHSDPIYIGPDTETISFYTYGGAQTEDAMVDTNAVYLHDAETDEVLEWTGILDDDGWVQQSFDVTPYRGQTVSVVLSREMEDDTSDVYRWGMVDNITLAPAGTGGWLEEFVISRAPDRWITVSPGGSDELGPVLLHEDFEADATFQWYKDGQLLEGETGPGLFIDDATVEQAGTYTVEVNHPDLEPPQEFETTVRVFEAQAPAAGVVGLGMLTLALAGSAAYGIRRMRR